MPNKVMNFNIQGMQRDLGETKFNPNFAYENMNIRITARDSNTLLTITNEKGNTPLLLKNNFKLIGVTIGYCVLNNILVLFNTSDNNDYIYKIVKNNNIYEASELISGNLNFNIEYPIETLGLFENENIQKVYWVDGINQPRVININKHYNNVDSLNFAISPKIDSGLFITKNETSSGMFNAGVIQYAYSYYNQNAQETSVIRSSPLYYISPIDRGLEENTHSNNSFNIFISDVDDSYDYIRIYSIYRSSINSTPEVSIVGDYKPSKTQYTNDRLTDQTQSKKDVKLYINEDLSSYITLDDLKAYTTNGTVETFENIDEYYRIETPRYFITNSFREEFTVSYDSYDGEVSIYRSNPDVKTIYYDIRSSVKTVDTNSNVTPIDPTILLYIGSEPVIANTISQKDNTLFLGNLELLRPSIQTLSYNGTSIKEWFKTNSSTKISNTSLVNNAVDKEDSVYYKYKINNNTNSSSSKVFKYGEHYRLGLQFQHKTGKWSEVVFIGDFTNNQRIKPFNNKYQFGVFIYNLNEAGIINTLVDAGYNRVRPVVCYPSLQDRKVIAQGIVCPTVYNFKHRFDHTIDVQSSWFMRPVYYGEYQTPYDDYYPDGNRGIDISYEDVKALPNCYSRRCEIQAMNNSANVFAPDSNYESYVESNSSNFAVDSNIVTFHSPDIDCSEELDKFDFSGLDFRITGIAQIDSLYGKYDVQTNNVGDNGGYLVDTPIAYDKGNIGSSGVLSIYQKYEIGTKVAGNKICASALWNDVYRSFEGTKIRSNFLIYPWHNSSTINGHSGKTSITKKILSNEIYASNSYYFDVNDFIEYTNGITTPQIYLPENSDGIIKIPKPENSKLEDLIYKGSIDNIITGNVKPAICSSSTPGVTGGTITDPVQLSLTSVDVSFDISNIDVAVPIKYKSNKHLVFGFNFENAYRAPRLPEYASNSDIKTLDKAPAYFKGVIPMYTSKVPNGMSGESRLSKLITKYIGNRDDFYNNKTYPSGVLIGDLYRKEVPNAFGGQSETSMLANVYYAAGETYNLQKDNFVSIVFKYGDTYYQRYDCLKTVPYDNNSVNSIVDITSVMCESRVNLNLRYDRNRGMTDNTSVTLDNFNKINTVYNQEDNYFSYHTLKDTLTLNKFYNSITWTKTKVFNEEVDTWTNITLASILDLDGDKGSLNGLKRFNNDIFAFQDKGISRILFNSRVQINASDGVPIEIANSSKVDGKVYITDTMGCVNKWSILTTPNGIYFIDNLNSSISLLSSDGIISLSDKLGFRTFIGDNNSLDIWNPVFNNSGFRTYYDATEDDVYFVNKDYCLCFSELLQQFTSFYSYDKVPAMFNIDNKFYSIYNNLLYEQNTGDYNTFYGKVKPYYITVIANQDPFIDKIFNTVEYESTLFNITNEELLDVSFDEISVWNDYQSATVPLIYKENKPSNLKRKFRTWRINIPRNNGTRDRIRGAWSYIKLSNKLPYAHKFKLHQLRVDYFD